MCIHTYICMYVYIYISIYMYTYIHTYTQIYINLQMHPNRCATASALLEINFLPVENRYSSAPQSILRKHAVPRATFGATQFTALCVCITMCYNSAVCVYYNVLQQCVRDTLQHTATQCNTLQHTVTHFNTLQHTATHTYMTCKSRGRSAIRAQVTKITATVCNRLQHAATCCNMLQHIHI